jgi:hypothetical protein
MGRRRYVALCALLGLVASCSSRGSARPLGTTSTTGRAPLATTSRAAASPLACPPAVTDADVLKNVDAPRDRLVPDDLASARLCRYYPLAGPTTPGYPHGRLEAQVAFDAPGVARLAALLGAIPAGRVRATTCPADFGSFDLLILGFLNRPSVTVRSSASGCPSITNGPYQVWSFSPQFTAYEAFINELEPRNDNIT